ncbi:MAG: tetraacyldisaccharide 4'-kinase [Deltaproteobacteria bacterium]|nr:tetraacyldisaccharide 4'-kinase [Deltaproteobacteria bacterium]
MSEYVRLLYGLGRPFSPLYTLAMSLRAAMYEKGLFRQYRLPAPVISLGNLTMGGTGKTPMAIYLAGLLAGKKPVIVSRGYGGKAKGRVNVVSDGRVVHLNASAAGDEPFYMAENLPGVPVLTSKNKVDGGRCAVSRFGAGVVIVDDGFQHLRLKRDLDLVLFKVDSFLGNNRVFPGGDMREPLQALARADAFVLTCVDAENRERAEAIKKALAGKFPAIPVFMTEFRPVSLVTARGEQIDLRDGPPSFFGFCGLANPQSFMRTLHLSGLNMAGFQVFRDHCPYCRPELDLLRKQSAKTAAQAFITTEKDLVKLKDKDLSLPLYALRMEVMAEQDFDDFVLEKLQGSST